LLLWSGQAVSNVGTQVSSIAFPLLVLALTNSPAKAGLAGFLGTLPYLLFSLPAGGLVDRWNRKRTMILCDVGRALAVVSIPLVLWVGGLSLAQVLVVAFADGSLYVLFALAESSAIPQVVPSEQLTAALGQNEARGVGHRCWADPSGAPCSGSPGACRS